MTDRTLLTRLQRETATLMNHVGQTDPPVLLLTKTARESTDEAYLTIIDHVQTYRELPRQLAATIIAANAEQAAVVLPVDFTDHDLNLNNVAAAMFIHSTARVDALGNSLIRYSTIVGLLSDTPGAPITSWITPSPDLSTPIHQGLAYGHQWAPLLDSNKLQQARKNTPLPAITAQVLTDLTTMVAAQENSRPQS